MPAATGRTLAATIAIFLLVSQSPGEESVARPDLGQNASLHGKPVFPPNSPWNQDISTAPVDANSNNLIKSIGLNKPLHPDFGAPYEGQLFGIPYVIVDGKPRGTTPLHRLALSPGEHQVTLDNPALGVSRTHRLQLAAGQSTTIDEKLPEEAQ